jgi:hypothetical protein
MRGFTVQSDPSKLGSSDSKLTLAILIGAPLFMIVVAVSSLFLRERAARDQFAIKIAQLRSEGMPVDNESMQQFINSLTSDQHVQEWLLVFASLSSEEFQKASDQVPALGTHIQGEIPAPGQLWPDQLAQQNQVTDEAGDPVAASSDTQYACEQTVRSFLDRWKELSEQAQRLALRQLNPDAQTVRFISDYKNQDIFGHQQPLRTASRLLRLRGELAAHDRDADQLSESVLAMKGCAAVIDKDALLVCQLIKGAIRNSAIDLLKTGIEMDLLNEKHLIEILIEMLEGAQIGSGWKTAMLGERAFVLSVFQVGFPGQQLSQLQFRSRDALYSLELFDRILDIPQDDLDQFLQGHKQHEMWLQQLRLGSWITQFDAALTSELAPSIDSFAKAHVQNVIGHRLAAIAIGLRLYEMRHGHFPEGLEELKKLNMGAEQLLDPDQMMPSGGRPFGYQLENDHAVLWGFDLMKEHCTPDQIPDYSTSSELPLWVWRLQATGQKP